MAKVELNFNLMDPKENLEFRNKMGFILDSLLTNDVAYLSFEDNGMDGSVLKIETANPAA